MKPNIFISDANRTARFFWLIGQFFLACWLLGIQTTTFAQTEQELLEADRLHAEFLAKYDAGKAAELRPMIERVLFLRKKLFGDDHPVVADTLLNVAILERDLGDYAKAESLLNRTLAMQEKAFGSERPEIVGSLYNLAILQRLNGNFSAAESLFRRGLGILEKAFGRESLEITGILNELAVLNSDKGDYLTAEPLFQRVVAIREKRLGKDNSDLADALFNLAILQRNRGDMEKAEPLFARTLSIQEKTLGSEHHRIADTLFNLAVIRRIGKEYQETEALLLRALAIQEKVFGDSHYEIAGSLNELGLLYRDLELYEKAETAFSRVVSILETQWGKHHYSLAGPLSGLAGALQMRKEYAKAESHLSRALSIQQSSLPGNHPDIAETFAQMARLCEASDRLSQAIEYQSLANQIIESNLARNLSAGSERQKMAYLNMLRLGLDLTISLQMKSSPTNNQIRQMALTALLQFKGRGLDVMADTIGNLRRSATPEEQKLFDQFATARAQLAQLLLDESGSKSQPSLDRIRKLQELIENLEAEISRLNAAFQASSLPVSLKSVQDVLPPNSALIEFAEYDPFEAKTGKFDHARYAVWTIEPDSETKSVDLGSAAEINSMIDSFRKALRDPQSGNVKQLARALDEKIMQPARKLLTKANRLLIAPDSQLNLIPFAALLDENRKYLIENYDISYLASGRDLLRLRIPSSSANPPVIIADPEFGDPPLSKARKDGTFRIDETKMLFQPLRGAREELRLIKSSLPGAIVLTKHQATETALKQINSPSLLHIATHGFFLSEEISAGNLRTRMSKGVFRVSNPLLRSGLALAGANPGKSGLDDGILTALEAAGLNLWGTKLVVLSACDTGVGDIVNGEGVYGLRRALTLAGAESLVMSLWPVADLSARDLMVVFYQRLQRGTGRSQSLREAQLQMLRSGKYQHPFHWAGFIQSGDWRKLNLSE